MKVLPRGRAPNREPTGCVHPKQNYFGTEMPCAQDPCAEGRTFIVMFKPRQRIAFAVGGTEPVEQTFELQNFQRVLMARSDGKRWYWWHGT